VVAAILPLPFGFIGRYFLIAFLFMFTYTILWQSAGADNTNELVFFIRYATVSFTMNLLSNHDR